MLRTKASRYLFFFALGACSHSATSNVDEDPERPPADARDASVDGGESASVPSRDAGSSPVAQADASSPFMPPANTPPPSVSAFVLSSPAFTDKGTLPVDYTCDGAGQSPPLAWTGAPAGTEEFALLATTLARDGLKWNWVVYRIAKDARALAVDQRDLGTFGLTSDGPALAYAPPCSQGPGAKTYTFTLYALSKSPELPMDPKQVTGSVLTSAVASSTLAKAELSVSYTRP